MSDLYGVRLLFGGWWADTDLDPMCGSKSTVFAKLKRDRQNPDYAAQLVGAKVVRVLRAVTLRVAP